MWVNMTGKNAELCGSLAEGIKKLQSMIAIRSEQGAEISPQRIAPSVDVRFVIKSSRYGTEEFWLSDTAESQQGDSG